MEEEDFQPRTKPTQPKPLDQLSVAELEAYIARLEAEIARAKSAIAAKKAHRSGADTLFRK
jgi:Uncharacterized small protein containing a coiled-coil domain